MTSTLAIPLDSPFFAGHFPGHPILPGIAHLAREERRHAGHHELLVERLEERKAEGDEQDGPRDTKEALSAREHGDEFPVSPMDLMAPTDWREPKLAELQAAGGKAIVFHGASDGVFSVNDTIRWYEALRAYFARGLAAYPDLRFELIDVMWGLSSVVLYYANQKGTKTGEFMEFGSDGKVLRVVANYSG